ncbi:MAG: hypothetical protein IJS97_05595 [Prevotella sp.]|nr:hypothetical protein [Prevotella sp.]
MKTAEKAEKLAGDEQEAGRILGLVSNFRLANYLRPMEADKETHQYSLQFAVCD